MYLQLLPHSSFKKLLKHTLVQTEFNLLIPNTPLTVPGNYKIVAKEKKVFGIFFFFPKIESKT